MTITGRFLWEGAEEASCLWGDAGEAGDAGGAGAVEGPAGSLSVLLLGDCSLSSAPTMVLMVWKIWMSTSWL